MTLFGCLKKLTFIFLIKKSDIKMIWLHVYILQNEVNVYLVVLRCHSVINHHLNYFMIIILKINKFIIYVGLWLYNCIIFFTLLVYNIFSLTKLHNYYVW